MNCLSHRKLCKSRAHLTYFLAPPCILKCAATAQVWLTCARNDRRFKHSSLAGGSSARRLVADEHGSRNLTHSIASASCLFLAWRIMRQSIVLTVRARMPPPRCARRRRECKQIVLWSMRITLIFNLLGISGNKKKWTWLKVALIWTLTSSCRICRIWLISMSCWVHQRIRSFTSLSPKRWRLMKGKHITFKSLVCKRYFYTRCYWQPLKTWNIILKIRFFGR